MAVEAKRRKWRTARAILADPTDSGALAFLAAAAAPPTRPPPARYCDVTGLKAHYLDPRTGLWYHNAIVYQHIKQLGPNQVQALLAIRNANVQI